MVWWKIVLWFIAIVVLVLLGFWMFGNGGGGGVPDNLGGVGGELVIEGGGEVVIQADGDSSPVDVDAEIGSAIVEEGDDLNLGDVI